MNILALDLATQLGYALGSRGGYVKGGSVSFARGKRDTPGARWLGFRNFLTQIGREAGEIHVIYYEEVRGHGLKGKTNITAAHVYGGFVAVLQLWAQVNNVRLEPVGVTVIKKHFTGRGNAKKEHMLERAITLGFAPIDDNHADAIALLDYARLQETGN